MAVYQQNEKMELVSPYFAPHFKVQNSRWEPLIQGVWWRYLIDYDWLTFKVWYFSGLYIFIAIL